jgi:hypothetical protein
MSEEELIDYDEDENVVAGDENRGDQPKDTKK